MERSLLVGSLASEYQLKRHFRVSLCVIACLVMPSFCLAEINVTVGVQQEATGFVFEGVSTPAANDAGAKANWTIADGMADRNSGSVAKLFDGRLPDEADQPHENFFFQLGDDGGRIVVDFGRSIKIKEISSFSWHPSSRAPQVYTLYAAAAAAADASAPTFPALPNRNDAPTDLGWREIATVDTRTNSKPSEPVGGEHGVTITANATELTNVWYLLFDIHQTESTDSFGNTFYSEIDVVDADAPAPKPIELDQSKLTKFTAADGAYRFTIDAKEAPDLAEWAAKELVPVVQKWYPVIVKQLPSDGFQPSRHVLLRFRNDMGGVPASAGGETVNLNAPWFRGELDREARGAVVHELVHVVQQYDRASRTTRNSVRTPGWIVEGIADYIRWYGYEPQSNGAEVSRQNAESAKYDSSYRVTANFLNWVTVNHDKEIVKKLNAAAREGRYDDVIWVNSTGKSVEELASLWKRALAQP